MAEVEIIFGNCPAKANHYGVSKALTGKGRFFKDYEIRAYEESFRNQCKIYKGRMIDTPFILYVRVYYRSCKSDLDNSLKTLLDCLQQTYSITDDNLCCKIVAEKRVDPHKPRVEFALEVLNEQKKLFS